MPDRKTCRRCGAFITVAEWMCDPCESDEGVHAIRLANLSPAGDYEIAQDGGPKAHPGRSHEDRPEHPCTVGVCRQPASCAALGECGIVRVEPFDVRDSIIRSYGYEPPDFKGLEEAALDG